MTDPGFEAPVRVGFAEADPAGVLFYPQAFRLAHAVYERFLESRGQGLAAILAGGAIALPVVHAEADFRAPLPLGAQGTGRLQVTAIGTSSYRLRWVWVEADGSEPLEVRTAHVCLHLPGRRPGPLPADLRAALETIRAPDHPP